MLNIHGPFSLVRFMRNLLWFPMDLFLFTFHCWLYTLSHLQYRILGTYGEQPCLFCQGGNVGEPRVLNGRMKYRNLWMPRLLNPEIEILPAKRKHGAVAMCAREGGYVRRPFWVPIAAVLLGAGWCCALGWVLWETQVIPEDLQREIRMNWFQLNANGQ